MDTDGAPSRPIVTSDGVVTQSYAPARDLAEFVIDYTIHRSGPAGSRVRTNRYLPGPANICLTFDAGPLRAQIRNWRTEWGSASMVFGPTSHAMEIESDGGWLAGFGVTPLGWSRLLPVAASRYANRILPLAGAIGERGDLALRDALAAAHGDDAIVAVLDRFIRARLAPPTAAEGAIRALSGMLLDPAIDDVATIVDRLDISPAALRRLTNHYFGFPPKLLLRRNRFLRALMAIADAPAAPADFATLAPGYHDRSHFIRDAQLFLGVTGRRFLHEMTPLMDALRRNRRARFGQPLQGLITPGRDNRPTLDDPNPPA